MADASGVAIFLRLCAVAEVSSLEYNRLGVIGPACLVRDRGWIEAPGLSRLSIGVPYMLINTVCQLYFKYEVKLEEARIRIIVENAKAMVHNRGGADNSR